MLYLTAAVDLNSYAPVSHQIFESSRVAWAPIAAGKDHPVDEYIN